MKTKIFKNILIVRTDRIGDVVLTTPAIKAIRHHYPGSRLSVLVTPATYDLVNGNPYIDEILVDDRAGQNKHFFGSLRLAREIRLRNFDLAIIFHTKRRYNLACYTAGVPYRLGFKNNKFGSLLTHSLKDTRALGTKHEAEYCLDVIKTLGVKDHDLDLFVPVQRKAEDWTEEWMRENNLNFNELIVIHPGASDPTKCWPSVNFAQLMDRLLERYTLKVVLIGSPQTVPVAGEILRQTRNPSRFIDLTGKTSLAQMASILRRSRLLISNDSGPVHVAAGVGTSVISLFLRNQAGINAERWKPIGSKSFILSNKQGEEIKLDAKGKVMAGHAGSISVDSVLDLTDQIFQKDNQYEIF